MEFLILLGVAGVVWYFMKGGKSNSGQDRSQNEISSLSSKTSNLDRREDENGLKGAQRAHAPAPRLASQIEKRPYSSNEKGRYQNTKLQRVPFCALDTETTGIVTRSSRHRAFEVSCVRFVPNADGTWAKATFTRYIKVDVQRLKGLKLSPMWNSYNASGRQVNAIEAVEALRSLREFIGDLPLVCHNAEFDRAVITNEIEKENFSWNLQNKWICTLRMARAAGYGRFVGYGPGRDDGKSYRLMDVAHHLNLVFDVENLHSGHYDASLAGDIFLKIRHHHAGDVHYLN